MKTRLSRIALILTVVLLPFAVHPWRFEPYDPNRVGVLALLLVVGLPALRIPRPTRHNRLLYIAIALWCVALVISTVFALSFSRALTGDLIRRMGLLTHLLLMIGILVGASLDVRTIGRGFWLAGVIVSVVILLQTFDVLPNPFQDAISDRVSGLIGTPPAVGGWLALALVWGVAGFTPLYTENQRRGMIYHAPTEPHRTQSRPAALGMIYLLGLGLIAIGLVLTQARGGLLAAAAGVYTLLLLLALTRRWRGLIIALIAAALLAVTGTVILSRIDWGDSFLTRLPLISRLNPALPDSPRIAREIIWGSTLEVVVNPAPLADVYGTPDPFYPLRRWFGHGLESFETVFRPLVTAELRRHEGGRPIDRAHNDWLDTGVTAGWFGIAARLLLWIGIAVVGRRILRNPPHPSTTSSTEADSSRRGMIYHAPTDAPIPAQPDTKTGNVPHPFTTIVMLAVAVAHFVDLTFNFTSVLTGWAFWLAVGVLLKSAANGEVFSLLEVARKLGGRSVTHPYKIEFSESYLVSGSGVRMPDNYAHTMYGAYGGWWGFPYLHYILFVCTTLFWIADMGADFLLQDGVGANSFIMATTADWSTLSMAAGLRPWDDRLWNTAANGVIREINSFVDAPQVTQDYLTNALTLNHYDAPSAYLMAVFATWQADRAGSVDDVEKWLDEAEAYHAAAARLMPGEPYIWREWGRFMLTYRGNETAARQYIERTLALDPGDAAALELLDSLAPLP